MTESPSALLIGDSEIDRVARLLDDLDIDFERVRVPQVGLDLPMPRRLLVVSGPCAARLPALLAPEGLSPAPKRLCIHNQDFLPLRERLRDLGFDYLVQSALDDRSLRVLLTQLLHPGGRRQADRLPLGGVVEYRGPASSGTAKLADVSSASCRILGAQGLRLDDVVTVVLPAELGGGAPLPLPGRVIRQRPSEVADPDGGSANVVRFSLLEPEVRERLDRLVRGERLGSRVTPLGSSAQGEPGAAATPCELPGDGPRDRRREVRHPYHGRVEVLELPGDAEGALGRDLSLDGVCITGGQRLKPGLKLTLALYGGVGSEPVVVQAEVIRANEHESALVFDRLTEAQQDRLAMLIAEPPRLETLDPTVTRSRVVPTQILRRR